MALTPKQNNFVAEYLVDQNATQAAIRAGYSPGSADVQGARLLGNARVRQLIDEALERRAARVEVKTEDVLRELLRLALVDVGRAYDESGRLLPLHEMPEDVRRAIVAVEVDESKAAGVVRKVKFADKVRGLELLGKHLRLFAEKVEVTGRVTLEELVLAASKKPEGT